MQQLFLMEIYQIDFYNLDVIISVVTESIPNKDWLFEFGLQKL